MLSVQCAIRRSIPIWIRFQNREGSVNSGNLNILRISSNVTGYLGKTVASPFIACCISACAIYHIVAYVTSRVYQFPIRSACLPVVMATYIA